MLSGIDEGLVAHYKLDLESGQVVDAVNDDSHISPLDVLLVIRWLSARKDGGDLPSGALYPDVNGDAQISPIDVLSIVRYLNEFDRGDAEGESAFVAKSDVPSAFVRPFDVQPIVSVPSDGDRVPAERLPMPEIDSWMLPLTGLPAKATVRDMILEQGLDIDDEDLEEVFAQLSGSGAGDRLGGL